MDRSKEKQEWLETEQNRLKGVRVAGQLTGQSNAGARVADQRSDTRTASQTC